MWYQTMLLVKTYLLIPRLPSQNVWWARYRRNTTRRFERTATAPAFHSSTRYGRRYSWHAVPIDRSYRDGGFGGTRDGLRAADRQLEHEHACVGWAEHQASAGQQLNIVCLVLPVSTILWFRSWIPTTRDRPESPMPSASHHRDHHFGTLVDPLQCRLRKLQSTPFLVVQLHKETTAIW